MKQANEINKIISEYGKSLKQDLEPLGETGEHIREIACECEKITQRLKEMERFRPDIVTKILRQFLKHIGIKTSTLQQIRFNARKNIESDINKKIIAQVYGKNKPAGL